MPRFWVLTDHVRREVVLVIRGTMSLNELAVDLTCDPAPFILPNADTRRPSSVSHSSKQPEGNKGKQQEQEPSYDEIDEELENLPGSFPFPMDLSVPFPRSRKNTEKSKSSAPFPRSRLISESGEEGAYIVHGGMLKMTRAMGGPGKPVHVAVRDALKRNKGYCTYSRFAVCARSDHLTCSARSLRSQPRCWGSGSSGTGEILLRISCIPD